MKNLIDIYDVEKECTYKGELYSVRDNGAIMRHPQEGKKPRQIDNKWTFGVIDKYKGYFRISSEPVHRIVATAFLGEPPSNDYVVDHIDTNRQNNRPSNLRWVTRLDNILLNDITRKKLEAICNCSIEEILNDITILRKIDLPLNLDWMKVVSQDEANYSLEKWRKWKSLKKGKNSYNLNNTFYYSSDYDKSGYPLEPNENNISLINYYNNLKLGKEFYYKYYSNERNTYTIIDYCLNEEKNALYVATYLINGIKKYFLTSIIIRDNTFIYETKSYFDENSIDKYMTIARGEEWTGGEVFDDYC